MQTLEQRSTTRPTEDRAQRASDSASMLLILGSCHIGVTVITVSQPVNLCRDYIQDTKRTRMSYFSRSRWFTVIKTKLNRHSVMFSMNGIFNPHMTNSAIIPLFTTYNLKLWTGRSQRFSFGIHSATDFTFLIPIRQIKQLQCSVMHVCSNYDFTCALGCVFFYTEGQDTFSPCGYFQQYYFALV